jgi:hypothetical protein
MKKTIIQILLSLSVLLFSACSEHKVLPDPSTISKSAVAQPSIPVKSEPPEPTKAKIDMKNCVCVQLWMPVCGENGKTYSNSCFTNCAGVKFVQGSCANIITD